MRPELDAQILDACPVLFRRGLRDGFRCEDGWFAILEQLSPRLEAICTALPPEEEAPVALQVKEKFGGLRFYLSRRTPEIVALIAEASAACESTCEVCGHPGENVEIRGWYQTVCPWCRKEKEERESGLDSAD
ncbi:MAG TPA: hypothetical protein PKO12_07355 [Holophaga sp.]|nr:hypothetical protein [Holophaga sp.]